MKNATHLVPDYRMTDLMLQSLRIAINLELCVIRFMHPICYDVDHFLFQWLILWVYVKIISLQPVDLVSE